MDIDPAVNWASRSLHPPGWSVHLCGKLSRDVICREVGCARLHLNTPRYRMGVALTPSARFVSHKRSSWVPTWFFFERVPRP